MQRLSCCNDTGTKSENVIYYLSKLPRTKRLKVKEITIDLSPSMKLIAKRAFPNATIVSDRFHVQKTNERGYQRS